MRKQFVKLQIVRKQRNINQASLTDKDTAKQQPLIKADPNVW